RDHAFKKLPGTTAFNGLKNKSVICKNCRLPNWPPFSRKLQLPCKFKTVLRVFPTLNRQKGSFRMVVKRWLLILALTVSATVPSLAQCDQLRPQRDVSFNTDQDCAPVTVTQFAITYYFNQPQ